VVVKPSKRKKVENKIVLESEDDAVEEPGGGSDEKLKVQVKEARVVTNDDIVSSGEDDMRVEVEEHLKNMNGTKSKGRAKGRAQIQHKNPPSSKQSLKAMEVQASEEESMAEDQEVSSPQQTRPRKAISGRGQVKRYTKGVDDIIKDGIDDLILKVRKPAGASSQTSGASSAKDAELAGLKEKIGWVSSIVTARVLHVFLMFIFSWRTRTRCFQINWTNSSEYEKQRQNLCWKEWKSSTRQKCAVRIHF